MQPYVIERDEPYHFNFFEYGTTHEINGRDVIGSFVIPDVSREPVPTVLEFFGGDLVERERRARVSVPTAHTVARTTRS